MTSPSIQRTSRLQEATRLARTILQAMDRGQGTAASLRQCERLAELMGDEFMKEYARRALQPGRTQEELQADVRDVRARRDAGASGTLQFLRDFQVSGAPLASQLKQRDISIGLLSRSVPEAETFAVTGRKSVKYTMDQVDFTESVEAAEAVLERVRNRLNRYTSAVLNRLLFEGVPEQVMEATRRKVDAALAKMCPQALEKFAVAYEELAGSSAENWTNACTEARRILTDFADAVFAPQDGLVEGRKVGKAEYINRLWAHAKQKISSESNREMALAELSDLGNRIDAVYRLSNKGVHAVVTKDEADRIIVRTYLLIADLL